MIDVRKILLILFGIGLIMAIALLVVVEVYRERPAAIIHRSEESPLESLKEPLWAAPDFQLIDSNGQLFRLEDLKGKSWLAAFIFTRCSGPCPLITQRMRQIQAATVDRSDFRLVSFSVDPDYDRPEVLAEYARQWRADTRQWIFLTAAAGDEMESIARQFKIAATQNTSLVDDVPDIAHGTNLLLVDGAGQVRAVYSLEDPELTGKVVAALARLESS